MVYQHMSLFFIVLSNSIKFSFCSAKTLESFYSFAYFDSSISGFVRIILQITISLSR